MSPTQSIDNPVITTSEFCKWLCLLEAVEAISQYAKEFSVDLERTEWVKPIAIQRYMNERLPAINYLVSQELRSQ